MPYPVAYRNGRNRQPSRTLRNFLGNESGFLRFPDGRGTWAHPTGDPVAPPPPMRRPPPPTPLIPPDPATRPQQDIPWWERRQMSIAGRLVPWALLAWEIGDTLWPRGFRAPFGLAPAGWSHVCGPFPYPGLPYKNEVHSSWSAADTVGSCIVPVGGQALSTIDTLPSPAYKTIIYSYGPNTALLPLKRWYTFDQYSTHDPAVDGVPTVLARYGPSMSSRAVPWLPLGDYNVIPDPGPVVTQPPATFTAPPFQIVAGYSVEVSTGVITSPQTAPGGLSYQPSHPDIRPRIDEREKKLAPGAGAVFKVLSQIGTWHSFIDALWRSLPAKYSHRRRSFAGRLEDILTHFDEIRWEKAARELLKYYAGYKAAGWAYGRLAQELVKRFGPRRGWMIYRGLMTGANLGGG